VTGERGPQAGVRNVGTIEIGTLSTGAEAGDHVVIKIVVADFDGDRDMFRMVESRILAAVCIAFKKLCGAPR